MSIKHLVHIAWKLILVILTCYSTIALAIFILKPVNTSYRGDEAIGVKFSRFLLRPTNDLFHNRLFSVPADWSQINIDSYNLQNDDLFLKASNPNETKLNNWKSYDWTSLGLSNPEQSIIIEPYNTDYKDSWSLIRCADMEGIKDLCESNNIFVKGQIKVALYRQEVKYIGLDRDGRILPLKQIQKINTSERLDIKYI